MFFISLAAVLLLLCSVCLIRGPEEPRVPEESERDLRVCALLPTGNGTTEPERDSGVESRRAAVTVEKLPSPMPVTTSGDRNGLPLGSRTWVRAAYVSCPPEGNFG